MLVLELGGKALVNHLAFAPNGRALVGTAEYRIVLWETLADGERAEWVTGGAFALHPRYTANGRWIFAGLTGLKRFDPKTGNLTDVQLWSNTTVGFDLSPTKPLVLVSQFEIGADRKTRVALWDEEKPARAGKIWEREFNEPLFKNWAAFLPGGDRFARVETSMGTRTAFDRRVTIFSTATGEPLGEPAPVPHDGWVSPDGRWLVHCYATAIDLFPFDPTAGEPGHIRNPSRKHFTGVAFHPGGKYLAATSNDETVKPYDVVTRQETHAFTWRIGKMRSIAFSPDGTLAAAGSDKGKVVVWDVDL